MSAPTHRIRLAGVYEASELLGISKTRLYALDRSASSPGTRHPLPRPLGRLRCGPVWDADELERWAEGGGRDDA